MRLIDADTLKGKKVYSVERHEKVVPVAEIDWSPTIGAIPVEWLEYRRECEAADVMLGIEGIGDEEICRSISVVLNLWEKERKQNE